MALMMKLRMCQRKKLLDITVHESGTAFCDECGGEISEESGGREPHCDTGTFNSSTVRDSNVSSGCSVSDSDSAPALMGAVERAWGRRIANAQKAIASTSKQPMKKELN